MTMMMMIAGADGAVEFQGKRRLVHMMNVELVLLILWP